jgi:hypothetical protein
MKRLTIKDSLKDGFNAMSDSSYARKTPSIVFSIPRDLGAYELTLDPCSFEHLMMSHSMHL